MMGGGFGGCIIAMIAKESVEAAKHDISRFYNRRYGTNPEMHDVEADAGAGELKE